jgi:hypothetical protein
MIHSYRLFLAAVIVSAFASCGVSQVPSLEHAAISAERAASIQPSDEAVMLLRCRATVSHYWGPGEIYPSDGIEAYLQQHPGTWFGNTRDGGNAIYYCR